MKCPRCGLKQESFSPLCVWQGCKQCRFGELSYFAFRSGGFTAYHEEMRRELLFLKRQQDDREVEEMIRGVGEQ